MKYVLISLSCLTSVHLSAQELDSLKLDKTDTILEEMVITTQIEPQSLKKSINNVRVITKKDIDNLGAVTLNDVLNQYINITVRPSSSSGKTTVSMFGLDANYFKILIDNVPVVNEGGLGNNTDLSQINLNDVEQIEIIEGAMGVTHGANAVSGILNIITKKKASSKLEITASLQEETVGKEYALFKEGRHIQGLKIQHKISDKWFFNMGFNRNDLKGFKGDFLGGMHAINDQKRGYKWLPKQQLQTNATLSYFDDKFRMFYKIEFLNEDVDFYNNTVQSGYSDVWGTYKYGNDERYNTNKIYQHLNFSGNMFDFITYNVSLSHQNQKRSLELFKYDLTNNKETNNTQYQDQAMEVIYSTGTFSNLLNNLKYNVHFGYEVVNNYGFAVVDDISNTKKEVNKAINNYDFFLTTDFNLSERLSLRPGFRYSIQNNFNNQTAYSLGGRYLFGSGFEVRSAIGKSYRTPDFYELYSQTIFDGHYFVGNENLNPEQSTSFEASIKKTTSFKNNVMLSNHLMISRSNIKDRITSALVGYEGATPKYEYINISAHNNVNLSTTHQFKWNNMEANLGVSLVWFSQDINNMSFSSATDYLFNGSFNANVSYTIPKTETTFSTYYKYIGTATQWVAGADEYVLSYVNSYSWLDASVRQKFFNNKLETTVGARNILNVSDVNQSRINEGSGHSVLPQLMLAYGRSYFVKLVYNLNFN